MVDDGKGLVGLPVIGRHLAGVQQEGHGHALAQAPAGPHLFRRAVPRIGTQGDKALVGKFLPEFFKALGTRETDRSAIAQKENQHDLALEVAQGCLAAVEPV